MTPAEEDALVAQAMTPASTFGSVTTEQSIRLAIRAAARAQGEKDAKICDDNAETLHSDGARVCADEIRQGLR